MTLDGKVYGIPEFNQVQVTMANADLLAAAGVTIEDVNGSDRAAMTEANEALTKADGGSLSVIGVDSKLPEFLPLWVAASGGSLLSDDGKTASLDSQEAIDSLTWAVGIYDDQGGFSQVKAFRDSADFFGEGNQFATNVLGAMPMEQWYINVLNEVSPDAPMAFDTVRTTVGRAHRLRGRFGLGHPLGHRERGCCLPLGQGDDLRRRLARGRRGAPRACARRRASPSPASSPATRVADEEIRGMVTSGGEPWDAGIEAMYEANDHTVSLPANPADAEFEQAMQDAVNSVLNGEATPEEALAEAQETAQKALDEGWKTLEEREGE